MTARISVVIPVFNRPDLLVRALYSVFNQEFKAVEVLVVDDGSSPPLCPPLLIEYPGVKILTIKKNSGVAKARNLGIQNAKEEWIALLDSDDEWEPEKLLKQVEYLQAYPDIRVVHTNEKWIRNSNEVIPPKYLDKSNHLLWERSLKHCLICPSSTLIHKSIFHSLGYFDESLTVCEDYDFWLRLLLENEIGLVHEKLTIKHGGHADQLSTTTRAMDRFRITSLDKILRNPSLNTDRKQLLLQVLIEKCSILAQGAQKRQKKEDAANYQELSEMYFSMLEEKSSPCTK